MMTDLPFPALVEQVQQAAVDVRRRIEVAGGNPEAVRVLAVTKGQPADAVRAAVAAGLVEVGESYVQELAGKARELETDPRGAAPRWHLIGRVQRNKVRTAASHVHLWQSVDRLSLAAEVAHRAPGAAVLVQLNVTGAPQQGGCPPERVAAVVEGCERLGLEVKGLMAIGARGAEHDVRSGFRRLREAADRLGLTERSMGMSGDLEAAVAEGSTMVRIGTALFGPRTGRRVVGN